MSGGFGLRVSGDRTGLFVSSLTPGGQADQIGSIRVGDRLVEINGKNIEGDYCEN